MYELSDDELLHLCQYFNCTTCGRVLATSKLWNRVMCRAPIWRNILRSTFANFPALFDVEEVKCKEKLRIFSTRDFQWTHVGTTKKCLSRFLHRSTVASNNCSYIFGGDSSHIVCYNDFWKVQATEDDRKVVFEKIHTKGRPNIRSIYETTAGMQPLPRAACSLCSIGDNIYLFGGSLREQIIQFSNEMWCLNTKNMEWHQLLTPPSSPPESFPIGRWGHTMVSYGNMIILFGGSCPGNVFNDVWITHVDNVQDSNTIIWRRILPSGGVPKARGGHSAVIIGDAMYIYGGNNLGESFRDLWRLHLMNGHDSSDTYFRWENLTAIVDCGEEPDTRIGHCVVAVGKYMLLYGGRDFHRQLFCNGVFLYDTQYHKWEKIKIDESIGPRTGHCPLICSSGILFYGGLITNDHCCADLVHLDLFGIMPNFIENEEDFVHIDKKDIRQHDNTDHNHDHNNSITNVNGNDNDDAHHDDDVYGTTRNTTPLISILSAVTAVVSDVVMKSFKNYVMMGIRRKKIEPRLGYLTIEEHL